jgi:hypothetical protein
MTVRVLGVCEHEVVIEHPFAVTATPVITWTKTAGGIVQKGNTENCRL